MELHFIHAGTLIAKMKGALAREFVGRMHEDSHAFEFSTKRFVGSDKTHPVFLVKDVYKIGFMDSLEIWVEKGDYIKIVS